MTPDETRASGLAMPRVFPANAVAAGLMFTAQDWRHGLHPGGELTHHRPRVYSFLALAFLAN